MASCVRPSERESEKVSSNCSERTFATGIIRFNLPTKLSWAKALGPVGVSAGLGCSIAVGGGVSVAVGVGDVVGNGELDNVGEVGPAELHTATRGL